MGVVAKNKKMPPLPLFNGTCLNAESQGFNSKKNGSFFDFNQVKLREQPRGSSVASDRPANGFIRGRNSLII